MNDCAKAAIAAGIKVISADEGADHALVELDGKLVVFCPLDDPLHCTMIETRLKIDTAWYSNFACFNRHCDEDDSIEVRLAYADYEDDRMRTKFHGILQEAVKVYEAAQD